MSIESQARWYAIKLILKYFSILAALLVIGYIDLFYMAVAVVAMLVVMIASAIFQDAYYSKLLELNKGRWNEHKD
jgi:ABC-type bacteriocin/lantibiotic exporter with double-glycine peptidase domain